MAFVHSNVDVYRAWSLENPTLEIGPESSVIASDFVRTEPARTADQVFVSAGQQANMFLLPEPVTPQPVEAAAAAMAVAVATGGGGEKGPAPPCLSYEFLSKAPKITSLVLKKN